MLTLAAAKGFWGCFSCTLLCLHCPPPTISSGRGVPCSHCSLSWGGRSTGKTLWCISGWKLISSVSKVFRENTSMWRGLSPLAELSDTLQPRLSGYRKPSATSRRNPPLTACMMHEPLTLWSLPPAQGTVNVQTTVERGQGQGSFGRSVCSTGWFPAGGECELRAAQEERQSQQTSGRANKPHILFVIKFFFDVCMCLYSITDSKIIQYCSGLLSSLVWGHSPFFSLMLKESFSLREMRIPPTSMCIVWNPFTCTYKGLCRHAGWFLVVQAHRAFF